MENARIGSALGLYRTDNSNNVAGSAMAFEVLPGVQYKVAENWWISGGVSVPVGTPRPDAGQLWQVTCWLQF